MPDRRPTGRPRRYCRQGCRQQAYIARREADHHGLGEGDVVVSRAQLEELAGRLYCLEAAIEDTEADLATGADDALELARMLDWLLVNARPAAAAWHESMAR